MSGCCAATGPNLVALNTLLILVRPGITLVRGRQGLLVVDSDDQFIALGALGQEQIALAPANP